MTHLPPLRAAGLLVAGLALAACSSQRSSGPDSATSSEPEVSADLEPFLESYFATWSRGDMEGYRGHFHDEAVVYMIRGGQVVAAMPLGPFIEGQAQAQAREPRGTERMTAFRAHEDRQAASVTVDWELQSGEERTVGVDRFTLIRDEQWRWKIVALVFYSTDHGRARR